MSIILAVLGSIIFSLVFILLAFVVPTTNEDTTLQKKVSASNLKIKD